MSSSSSSWRRAPLAAALCLVALAAGGAEAVTGARQLRRVLVPAVPFAEAAVQAPRPGAALAPALIEEGPVPVRGCRNCRMDDEPQLVQDAVDPETQAEWRKHTDRRAANALSMLREYSHMPSANENRQEADIAEDRHLLSLAAKLKTRLQDVLARQGVIPRLPSESHTYTDATGMHWEDAAMWDDTDNLNLQQFEALKRDHAALRREEKRMDVPEWHGSSTNNRLINEANPLRPVTVSKLQGATPCSGGSCAKVKTVPTLPVSREQVEAQTTF